MANHMFINQDFSDQYDLVAGKVLGLNESGARNVQLNGPDEAIVVQILSVVEDPSGADDGYVDDEPIQFTAREVFLNRDGTSETGILSFDSTVEDVDRVDTFEQFDTDNLYGLNIDFTRATPLDLNDTYVGKILEASTSLFRGPTEAEDEVVWSIEAAVGATDGELKQPWVIITSVVDAANYVGNVLTSPEDPAILLTDVPIVVKGATSNDYSVGKEAFATAVDITVAEVTTTHYYLAGGVLG